MSETLKTGISNVRSVSRYIFAEGALSELPVLLGQRRGPGKGPALFLIDEFFKEKQVIVDSAIEPGDLILFIPTQMEPTTDGVDKIVNNLREEGCHDPCVVVGLGGGSTLDTVKAVSNLLTNGGIAAQYQGWDLVREPGVY